MYQPGVYAFGQLLDFLGLFQARDRQHVAIVLLQFLLQLFGQLDKLGRVLQVLFVIGLQHFFLLRFPVGKGGLIAFAGGDLMGRPGLWFGQKR